MVRLFKPQHSLLSLLGLLVTWMAKGSIRIPRRILETVIKDFEEQEFNRSQQYFRGTDRRPSTPFITGDGFRSYCQHICEEQTRCRLSKPETVKYGECIFVKSDCFDSFVKDAIPHVNTSYIIVSHNGDLSAPDGQDDAPRIGMPKYVTSDLLKIEYEKGRLLAFHGQNLWWKNHSFESRPSYFHCLPIGFENRQYPIGKHVQNYVLAWKHYILDREPTPEDKKPLLLIAFYPKSRVPDRHKVLQILGVIQPKNQPKIAIPFYNYTDLNHLEWLEAIVHHKFVLAPFGHGLDTHRISEILFMGGIPVMRKSTISSCYDDSDNRIGDSTIVRGSLPIVIVDKWEDVTKERLDQEWERIKKIPAETWDWSRLFMPHWISRIFPHK